MLLTITNVLIRASRYFLIFRMRKLFISSHTGLQMPTIQCEFLHFHITSSFRRHRGRWDISHRCLRTPRAQSTDSGRRRSFPVRCTSVHPPRCRTTSPWSSYSCRRCSQRGTYTPRSDIRHDLIKRKQTNKKARCVTTNLLKQK